MSSDPWCSRHWERNVNEGTTLDQFDHIFTGRRAGNYLWQLLTNFSDKIKNNFLENIDNGNLCRIIIIDVCKVFDLVDHELIIHKLCLYGCSDRSLQWFLWYHSGCYQHVSYDGHLSDPLPIYGSQLMLNIRAPFLILFVNDFALEVENAHLEMYADDSILCTEVKSVETIKSTLTIQAIKITLTIQAIKSTLTIQAIDWLIENVI